MRERSFLQGLCLTISFSCSLEVMFNLFLSREGLNTDIYPLCIIAYIPFIYALNYILLGKERSLSAIALVNFPLCIGFIVFSVINCGAIGFAGILIRVVTIGILTYYVIGLCESAPSLSTVFIALDAGVIILAGSLVFTVTGNAGEFSPVIPLAACAFALLALIDCRMGKVLGPGGFAVVAAGLGGCGLLGLLFSRYLASYAGAGLVAFAEAIFASLKYIVGLIGRLLLWLMSLIPAAEDGGGLEEAAESMAGLGAFATEEEQTGAGILIALCAAIIIAAVIIIIALRKIKLGGKRAPHTVKRSGSRVSLAEALRIFFTGLKQKLHRALLLISKRKTAGGVYFRLERYYSRTPLARKAGETPRNFLERIRALNGSDPEYRESFDRLIAATELAFYAPGGENPQFAGERKLYKLTAKQKACILKNAKKN